MTYPPREASHVEGKRHRKEGPSFDPAAIVRSLGIAALWPACSVNFQMIGLTHQSTKVPTP